MRLLAESARAGCGAASLSRRGAAMLNPGRLPAPSPALALQLIIANNIDETNTRMLQSMRPANDTNDT